MDLKTKAAQVEAVGEIDAWHLLWGLGAVSSLMFCRGCKCPVYHGVHPIGAFEAPAYVLPGLLLDEGAWKLVGENDYAHKAQYFDTRNCPQHPDLLSVQVERIMNTGWPRISAICEAIRIGSRRGSCSSRA